MSPSLNCACTCHMIASCRNGSSLAQFDEPGCEPVHSRIVHRVSEMSPARPLCIVCVGSRALAMEGWEPGAGTRAACPGLTPKDPPMTTHKRKLRTDGTLWQHVRAPQVPYRVLTR